MNLALQVFLFILASDFFYRKKKTYDMGLTALLPLRRRRAADFYCTQKSITSPRSERANLLTASTLTITRRQI
jgi:hypothetical protein